VRHHLLLLNSLLIHTSLGIVWSFRNHCISVEILVWTSKAMAQFADSGSTNCEIPLPAKIFSFGVVLYGPESWCGESCHSELFSYSCISLISLCIASIVLLLDWVFLTFQRPFFLLVVGLQIFLFLSAAAVFSAELFLFLCLCLRHHYHITIFMCLLFYRLFWDVCCLLSSCSLESLKFCSPFLVCDVRRFRRERFHCLRHGGGLLDRFQRECSSSISFAVALWAFFGWNTVGANVGGPKKSDEVP
jgi:hypothetical protein